jgi:hypothetical protein
MRVEVDEMPRGLTIPECRPPWSELLGAECTRTPIARLTHSKQSGEWTLYYADRNALLSMRDTRFKGAVPGMLRQSAARSQPAREAPMNSILDLRADVRRAIAGWGGE